MQEGDLVTPDILKQEWNRVLSVFDWFISEGNKVRPVRFIVRHIIEKGYDGKLFPGTSLFSLLISIPVDHKVNYAKTLRITFDTVTEHLQFRYTSQENSVRRMVWEEACQATEGNAILDMFFLENKDFKDAIDA